MTEQAKFLAVNVVRDYDFIEHVEVSRLGLTSTATVIVSYNVEYSFGFDLKPDSFDIQAGPSGIELRIGSPILVAAPAVMPANFEIPDKGYFVDEKAAIIAIHHRLPGIARAKGLTMAQDAEIRAVCEKKLLEFLREFLGKQPGVKQVPAITVAYR
jgi:hypothetical protein